MRSKKGATPEPAPKRRGRPPGPRRGGPRARGRGRRRGRVRRVLGRQAREPKRRAHLQEHALPDARDGPALGSRLWKAFFVF